MQETINKINEFFNVDVRTVNPKRSHADVRKMLSNYLRNERGCKYQQIADAINQDHSNVINNVKKHINLYQTDKEYRKKYDDFVCTLK